MEERGRRLRIDRLRARDGNQELRLLVVRPDQLRGLEHQREIARSEGRPTRRRPQVHRAQVITLQPWNLRGHAGDAVALQDAGDAGFSTKPITRDVRQQLAQPRTAAGVEGLLAIAGMAHAVFSATRHTILQRASPDHMRGRVMGIHLLVTRGVSPLSQTLTGLLVHGLGPTGALLLATLMVGAVTAVLAARNSPLSGDLSSP